MSLYTNLCLWHRNACMCQDPSSAITLSFSRTVHYTDNLYAVILVMYIHVRGVIVSLGRMLSDEVFSHETRSNSGNGKETCLIPCCVIFVHLRVDGCGSSECRDSGLVPVWCCPGPSVRVHTSAPFQYPPMLHYHTHLHPQLLHCSCNPFMTNTLLKCEKIGAEDFYFTDKLMLPQPFTSQVSFRGI